MIFIDNKEYWQKRNESQFLSGEKKGLNVAEALKANYEESIKRITSELYMFYAQYAKDGKMDLQEAKKLLDKSQLKDFKSDLKEFLTYAKEHNYSNDEKNQIKLLQTKSKVSRLEQLKAKLNYELSKLTNEAEEKMHDFLANTYQDTYNHASFNIEKNVGYKMDTDFVKVNDKLVEKALTKEYNGSNYSSAIWQNKNNLMTTLNQYIPQGLTLGYNPKKLADIVDKKLQTGYNNTVRLIRTEYNYLMNEATSDSYKSHGITKYQILATLDDRTSEICQEMDGQVFDLADKEVGVNYPPFHPNCRSTTIPYFEPDEIDEEFGIGTRLAKDEDGKYYQVPSNMTYNEWKKEKES